LQQPEHRWQHSLVVVCDVRLQVLAELPQREGSSTPHITLRVSQGAQQPRQHLRAAQGSTTQKQQAQSMLEVSVVTHT
jgi:hypothetical protein